MLKEKEPPLSQLLKGSNQSHMRAYNERLVLSLIRINGQLPKAKIAQMTGLSAQTASVIMRALEKDGLLIKDKPIRGKVGQPSIPLSLNPDGAYFLGLKIGRRSCELILVDFLGQLKQLFTHSYDFPEPQGIEAFVLTAIRKIESGLGIRAKRIAGLGIAMPFEIWNWGNLVDVSADKMNGWKTYDIQKVLKALFPYPVYLENDATAACGAELVFGKNPQKGDFTYFYIGTFIGGGLVINGSLFLGKNRNAAAVGSMLINNQLGNTCQLIDEASIVTLEKQLLKSGVDSSPLWHKESGWQVLDNDEVELWIARVSRALAQAIISTTALFDQEITVIDGAFPSDIRLRIIKGTREAIKHFNQQGIVAPKIITGSLGRSARALGGASLALFDRYLVDKNIVIN